MLDAGAVGDLTPNQGPWAIASIRRRILYCAVTMGPDHSQHFRAFVGAEILRDSLTADEADQIAPRLAALLAPTTTRSPAKAKSLAAKAKAKAEAKAPAPKGKAKAKAAASASPEQPPDGAGHDEASGKSAKLALINKLASLSGIADAGGAGDPEDGVVEDGADDEEEDEEAGDDEDDVE